MNITDEAVKAAAQAIAALRDDTGGDWSEEARAALEAAVTYASASNGND